MVAVHTVRCEHQCTCVAYLEPGVGGFVAQVKHHRGAGGGAHSHEVSTGAGADARDGGELVTHLREVRAGRAGGWGQDGGTLCLLRQGPGHVDKTNCKKHVVLP